MSFSGHQKNHKLALQRHKTFSSTVCRTVTLGSVALLSARLHRPDRRGSSETRRGMPLPWSQCPPEIPPAGTPEKGPTWPCTPPPLAGRCPHRCGPSPPDSAAQTPVTTTLPDPSARCVAGSKHRAAPQPCIGKSLTSSARRVTVLWAPLCISQSSRRAAIAGQCEHHPQAPSLPSAPLPRPRCRTCPGAPARMRQ